MSGLTHFVFFVIKLCFVVVAFALFGPVVGAGVLIVEVMHGPEVGR